MLPTVLGPPLPSSALRPAPTDAGERSARPPSLHACAVSGALPCGDGAAESLDFFHLPLLLLLEKIKRSLTCLSRPFGPLARNPRRSPRGSSLRFPWRLCPRGRSGV